jgi:hypothetical protein
MEKALITKFVHECAKEPNLEVLVSVNEHRDSTGAKDCEVFSKLHFDGCGIVVEKTWKRYEKDDEEYNSVDEANVQDFIDVHCRSLAVEKKHGRTFIFNRAPKTDLPMRLSYVQMIKALALLGVEKKHSTAQTIASRETTNPDVSAELHRYSTIYLPVYLREFDRRFVYAAIRAVSSKS